MMSHLSISEKLSCNVCNFPFVDRVDQVNRSCVYTTLYIMQRICQ